MVRSIILSIVVAVVIYVVILIVAAVLSFIGAGAIAGILQAFGWILAVAAGVWYYFTHRI